MSIIFIQKMQFVLISGIIHCPGLFSKCTVWKTGSVSMFGHRRPKSEWSVKISYSVTFRNEESSMCIYSVTVLSCCSRLVGKHCQVRLGLQAMFCLLLVQKLKIVQWIWCLKMFILPSCLLVSAVGVLMEQQIA
jgi:hypothetical protein